MSMETRKDVVKLWDQSNREIFTIKVMIQTEIDKFERFQ